MFMKGEDGGDLFVVTRKCCIRGRHVSASSVVETVTLALTGQAFEVLYYPRAFTAPCCVKVSDVEAALRIQWCSGLRVKMEIEVEGSFQMSEFKGTVSDVNVFDPIRWKPSHWKLLEVEWDNPEMIQHLKRVNPWLVKVESDAPPPGKRIRSKERLFIGLTPLGSVPDNVEGARHNVDLRNYDLNHSPPPSPPPETTSSSPSSPSPIDLSLRLL